MIVFRYTADLMKISAMKEEKCAEITECLRSRNDKKSICFLSRINTDNLTITGASESREGIKFVLDEYISKTDFQVANGNVKEITLEIFLRDLYSINGRFVNNSDEIKEMVGLNDVFDFGFFEPHLREIVFEASNKKAIISKSSKVFYNDMLKKEIERIFNHNSSIKAHGHPVHYLIQKRGYEEAKNAYTCLMQALYEQKRINQKRYFCVDLISEADIECLKSIYMSSVNGCVVLRLGPIMNGLNSNENKQLFERIYKIVNDYKNDVLTIISIQSDDETNIKRINSYLNPLLFVELTDNELTKENAIKYASDLCKKSGVNANKELIASFNEEKTYSLNSVEDEFKTWYNQKLIAEYYPEYKEVISENNRESNSKTDAYSELMDMIGLSEAKKVIAQAVNYFKVQKMLKDKGFSTDKPTMHMAFIGEAGTAKTTVARLFSRIMAENGILSKGHLVEVGRADLVAQYVGHTARCVQDKFEEARGGVLFCDEIYSLVDDRRGSFGDEAINTIVQEMENHREDVIVIFAGYPDKMEQFISVNPGLKSRIAFHVPFDNYSVEDLLSISSFIAKTKGMKISDSAMIKLKKVYESVRKTRDFGNGRFVRNCIEQAKMNMATRLLKMDYDKLTEEVCSTILEEDIEMPKSIVVKNEKPSIGFVA